MARTHSERSSDDPSTRRRWFLRHQRVPPTRQGRTLATGQPGLDVTDPDGSAIVTVEESPLPCRSGWSPLDGPVRLPAKRDDGSGETGHGPCRQYDDIASREQRVAGGVL